jgi:hypothetical protein
VRPIVTAAFVAALGPPSEARARKLPPGMAPTVGAAGGLSVLTLGADRWPTRITAVSGPPALTDPK